MDEPLPDTSNPVVETYSRLATDYDGDDNVTSCWGRATQEALDRLRIGHVKGTIVDVGCGTGRELADLASRVGPDVQLIGVEPADNMRELAALRNAVHLNVRIVPGSFESLPLTDASVDYLYSILAFHWTTDLERSIAELTRVLKPDAEMYLTFIGRQNGREFITKTTPVFFKYMTPAAMVRAVSLRKQLTLEEARGVFGSAFGSARLEVTESFQTYYDSLERHWSWWVRVEGQLLDIAPEKRERCDSDVKLALSSLETSDGIPYTIHLLHVTLANR